VCRLILDGIIGGDDVSDYRCGVSRGQERHRVAAAAFAVGAIPFAHVGMTGYAPRQCQHRQEDESHEHHAQTARASREFHIGRI
jgi:hypothetical protein